MKLTLDYKAPGPVVEAFLSSSAYIAGLMGPFGSGKSSAAVIKGVQRGVLQVPSPIDRVCRTRRAIIRNTYPELRTTTMKDVHDWISETTGEWRPADAPPHHTVRFQLGERIIEIEMLFLALDRPDDMRRLLSLQLSSAWINEARQIAKEAYINILGRVNRYPPMREGGCTAPGVDMDTNPPDTEHWWYELFEEQRPPDAKLFRQPSGLSAKAENIPNLPVGYYQRLAENNPPEWVRVHVHGEYGYSRDGEPVYPEYQDSLHCAPEALAPVKGLPILLGADAGRQPAVIVAQRDAFGRWYVLDELVGWNMSAKAFAPLVNKLLGERYRGFEIAGAWGDPAAGFKGDQDEHTWLEIMSAETKLAWRPAPVINNNLTLRLEAVRQPLTKLIDGRPMFILSPRCVELRRGFMSGYRYRRLQVAGSPRYDEKPEKNKASHPHDALQYLMLGGGESGEVLGRARAQTSTRWQTTAIEDGDGPGLWMPRRDWRNRRRPVEAIEE